MVILCTNSLTFNNCTFCPHSVFMCFVWIWEQTAIISLYSINWLVFITEMERVYCAVRSTLYVLATQFVWTWEQTANISLYSINWLVFVTEMESVYFSVRTGYLKTIQVNCSPLKSYFVQFNNIYRSRELCLCFLPVLACCFSLPSIYKDLKCTFQSANSTLLIRILVGVMLPSLSSC